MQRLSWRLRHLNICGRTLLKELLRSFVGYEAKLPLESRLLVLSIYLHLLRITYIYIRLGQAGNISMITQYLVSLPSFRSLFGAN